jgi:transcriptional regulator with XRE-family HTH domain
MISGWQIRAARGFVGWTARDLARKAVVGIATVQKIESGESTASLAELVDIQATLAAEGIEFAENHGAVGVQLRPTKHAKEYHPAGKDRRVPHEQSWTAVLR